MTGPVQVRTRLNRQVVGLVVVLTVLAGCLSEPDSQGLRLPPANANWDLQLGGDYEPADGVSVVERDWWSGEPAPGLYSICYINAFQTQRDEPDSDRPDQTRKWPPELVLGDLEDPNWPGEYLVDISTAQRRAAAAEHVGDMIGRCAEDGWDAVELDNLDSWQRFGADDPRVPFGRAEATAYAGLLVEQAHNDGLAVAQKNAVELLGEPDLDFDFAVVEECGQYEECEAFTAAYPDATLIVEYTEVGFQRACAAVSDPVSVIRRDQDLAPASAEGHVYATCEG